MALTAELPQTCDRSYIRLNIGLTATETGEPTMDEHQEQQDPQMRAALDRVSALIKKSQERMPSPLPTREWRRRLRKMQRLTVREVARAVGVSAATVSAWEGGARGLTGHDPAGRNRQVYAELLRKIAEIHGVEPEMARTGNLVRPTPTAKDK